MGRRFRGGDHGANQGRARAVWKDLPDALAAEVVGVIVVGYGALD
jgi:hypothetical protein